MFTEEEAVYSPVANRRASSAQDALHLSRTPIFNAKFEPLGYEMRLSGAKGEVRQTAFFFDAFTSMPAEQALGDAPAYLSCEWDEIVPDFEAILDPKRLVIDLAAPKNGADLTSLIETVNTLRARGFGVAIGEYALQNDLHKLLPRANFLKIDTRKINPKLLHSLPQQLAKITSLQLIAVHISSAEIMEALVTAGYHGLHGIFPVQKIDKKIKTINSSRQSIMLLMSQAQGDAEISEMAASLKGDPGLSFNLLRYVNSAAFAQHGETTSLSQAVNILGRKRLYRWLCMRLLSCGNHPAQGMLLKAALIRGRMMELLAPQCTPPLSPDDAFIVGVFSLLDKLMGVSIQEAVEDVQLPQPVLEAMLVQDDGPLGRLLFSIQACELPDQSMMLTYEYDLGIEGMLPKAHLNAMQWAESINFA